MLIGQIIVYFQWFWPERLCEVYLTGMWWKGLWEVHSGSEVVANLLPKESW